MPLSRRDLLISVTVAGTLRGATPKHRFIRQIEETWICDVRDAEDIEFNAPTLFTLQHGRLFERSIGLPHMGAMGDRAPFRELARRKRGELLYMEGFGEFMGRPDMNIAFCLTRDGTVLTQGDHDKEGLHFGIGLQSWIIDAAESELRSTGQDLGYSVFDTDIGKKALAGDIPLHQVIATAPSRGGKFI